MQDDNNPLLWTTEQLGVRIAQLLQEKDEAAIQTLFSNLQGGPKELRKAHIDALFANDRPDLVGRLSTNNVTSLTNWARDHFEYMVENCPKSYDMWEDNAYGYTMSLLNDMFVARSAHERETILKGLGSTKCELRFHELLSNHADLWTELSPAWVGARDSSLRQTAMSLGWQQEMLLPMFHNDDVPTDVVCKAFLYPYSTFATLLIVQESNRQGSQLRDVARHAEVETIECPAVANSRDMALANLLMAKAQSMVGRPLVRTYRFQSTAGVVEQADDLMNVVHAHVALNCLQDLAQALANDILPGIGPQDNLELPDLNGPSL